MTLGGRSQYALLALVLIAAAALRLSFSTSISGNDDLSVAGCAWRLLQHGFAIPEGHYCARYGLVLPMAGIFGMAGTGVAQLSLLPALASLAGMLLAWRLGDRLLGPPVGVVAAGAMALFPLDIEFAGLAFPDALQDALLAASVLCLLRATDRGGGWAVAAGASWAWAYYVKIDSGLLAFVIGLAWLFGLVRLSHAFVAGCVALALVGVEMVVFGAAAREPLMHLRLESTAANEVLGAGQDYRNLLAYPKAMFLVPYQSGVAYFAWVVAIAVAIWKRSRPALFLAAWSAFWLLWLVAGADPFSGFRAKPQIPRYLLSFAIPVMVLNGWLLVLLWRRSRVSAVALACAAAASTIVLAPFNQLAYEAAMATRLAFAAAEREGWFPLCPDLQSAGIVEFLQRGTPAEGTVCVVQTHDFLTGTTAFAPPPSVPAFLLVNEDFARRLAKRNLVRPIDPEGFGLHATEKLRIDNPMPRLSYALLHGLATAAKLLPVASLRDSIASTAAEVDLPADARIWRLDPKP